MKKFSVLGIVAGVAFNGFANAADITIYYMPTCPHCHHARDFISDYIAYEFPSISVTEVNVSKRDNQAGFLTALTKCSYTTGGVPVMVIGEKCFQGYADSMQSELRDAVAADLSDADKESAKKVQDEMKKDAKEFRKNNKSAEIINGEDSKKN